MTEVEKRFGEYGDTFYYKKGTEIFHREDGPASIWTCGSKFWYKDGKLHREGAPAAEWANGTKEWYFNGELHREDGPAVEYSNGTVYWCKNGELHREDGPAVEYTNGTKAWYLNDKEVTEGEVMGAVEKKVDDYGNTFYYKKGTDILHREDGPAVESYKGTKEWYLNGKKVTEEEVMGDPLEDKVRKIADVIATEIIKILRK